MSRSTRNKHRTRAILGVTVGLFLAVVAAVVSYIDFVPGKGTKWILLIVPAVPLVAWGCSHLAIYKGYPSGAGCGLFIVAFFTAGLIGATRSPITVGLAMVFMVILPVVVLLVIPNKSRGSRRY